VPVVVFMAEETKFLSTEGRAKCSADCMAVRTAFDLLSTLVRLKKRSRDCFQCR
jgi:hypothetical protein